MKLQRLSPALVAGVCALALTACGADSNTSTAALTKESFATQVAAQTADASSVHVAGTVSARGMLVSLRGDLAVNGKSISDLVARFHVQVPFPRGSATLLVTDGAAYLKTAGFSMVERSAKPWLKADLTDPSDRVAGLYDKLMARLTPASMARAFRATSQLRRVGAAKVAGVAATHYVVTVDTDKVLRVFGFHGGDRKLGRDHHRSWAKFPKTFHYDLWLDESQRPLRIQAKHAGFAVDLTLTAWGEPVSVQAPPSRLVHEVSF